MKRVRSEDHIRTMALCIVKGKRCILLWAENVRFWFRLLLARTWHFCFTFTAILHATTQWQPCEIVSAAICSCWLGLKLTAFISLHFYTPHCGRHCERRRHRRHRHSCLCLSKQRQLIFMLCASAADTASPFYPLPAFQCVIPTWAELSFFLCAFVSSFPF